MSGAEHPADPAPAAPSLQAVLSGAVVDTRKLLSGPGRTSRWKPLWLLAAMAGVVGVGAAPPPLGLLQPFWTEPSLRSAVFGSPAVVGGLLFLAVFLLLMGGVSRSFTLAFAEGIVTGTPAAGRYRAWLGRGAAHFVWSSALTLPLYFLLFGAEALVTRDAAREITAWINSPAATETELMVVLTGAVVRFLLVLIPWTLLTLPAMVFMYELTPAAMVLEGKGPLHAARKAGTLARTRPRLFLAYVGARYPLQFAGNMAAFAALAPCLLASAPLTVPLAGGGWWAAAALGGPSTGAGAGVLTVGVLSAAVAFYCVLCLALLPVSIFLYALALRVCGRS